MLKTEKEQGDEAQKIDRVYSIGPSLFSPRFIVVFEDMSSHKVLRVYLYILHRERENSKTFLLLY